MCLQREHQGLSHLSAYHPYGRARSPLPSMGTLLGQALEDRVACLPTVRWILLAEGLVCGLSPWLLDSMLLFMLQMRYTISMQTNTCLAMMQRILTLVYFSI